MQKAIYILCFLCLPVLLKAQLFKLDENSKVLVTGTSTMHDWESRVEEVSGSLEATIHNSLVTTIKSLDLFLEVESINSGKKKMDKLTYQAFHSEVNPQITFVMSSVKSLEADSATVIGTLSMAGNTHEIEVNGNVKVNAETIQITSSKTIDMTQFGMERPTAMLGAIKVGAEITVDFNLIFINVTRTNN